MTRIAAAAICLAALLATAGCAPVGVAVGAAAGVGTAAVQERGIAAAAGDARIKAEISHLLFQKDHTLFGQVTADVQEGRVLLTGAVPTPEARVDAVRLAWQAEGVREVLNELQIADNSSVIDYGRDVVIANTLRSKLLLDREVRNVNFTVEVVNSVVYLMGIARDQIEMDRVLGHARNVEHVRRVVNYIVLRDDPRRPQKGS